MVIIKELIKEEKDRLENTLVSMGDSIIPNLIDSIQNTNGEARGFFAMVLIRIGESCIPFLKKEAEENNNFKWMAEYLINEIKLL